MEASSGGTARGIHKLTGDAVDTLLRYTNLQRLRVHQIAAAVGQDWSRLRTTSGKKIADPYGSPSLAMAREDAVAHQLCEWAKADFSTTIKQSKTIAAGRG